MVARGDRSHHSGGDDEPPRAAPTASAMESDLDRGDSHSQEVSDLRRGEGVGSVQQDYDAVLIGQEIETPMNACTGLSPFRDVERRGGLRNWQL